MIEIMNMIKKNIVEILKKILPETAFTLAIIIVCFFLYREGAAASVLKLLVFGFSVKKKKKRPAGSTNTRPQK